MVLVMSLEAGCCGGSWILKEAQPYRQAHLCAMEELSWLLREWRFDSDEMDEG